MNSERKMNQSETLKRKKSTERQRLQLAIILSLLALVSVTAASVAWFTLADFTKVYSMSMDVTSGTNLRFDLDVHKTYEEYVKTLNFEQIADRMKRDKGFDMRTKPLEPVTTSDYVNYSYEDGRTVSVLSGAYLEYELHFYATNDMYVHLTSAHSSQSHKDGTSIGSSNKSLPKAMRISFTIGDKVYVYHPGMSGMQEHDNVREFGLPDADNMILNDDNMLFYLPKETDQPVTVRIWLEGTDPVCDDSLRKSDYQISMRFIGTDKDNNILDGARN